MILREMEKVFLESRKRGVAGAKRKCTPSTLQSYERHLEPFLQYLENLSISDYTQVRRLHILGFNDFVDEATWSLATRIQCLRVIRIFLRWVAQDEECQAEGLKPLHQYLPVLGKTPRRTDIPDNKVILEFRNSFTTRQFFQYRNYVATCLLMDTGMRIGELCTLQPQSVLVDQSIIIVTGKTGPRPVATSTPMVKLLGAYLKRRQKYLKGAEVPVFFSRKLGPTTKDTWSKAFSGHCKKYKLPRITPHTLRHAFCTNFLRKGGDMEKLRLMTGHTNYAMLQGYLHLAKIGSVAMKDELDRVTMLND